MHPPEPIAYSLRLTPDLDTLEFSGSVRIEVETQGNRTIVLDSVELEIGSCTASQLGKELELTFAAGEGAVRIELTDDPPERIDLLLDFSGRLNTDLRGFYAAAYAEQGIEKHLAVTQFEEIDARRAFPCFDHPKHNTPFKIELVVRNDHAAISTTGIEEESNLENGMRLVRFRQTPPMPTYLLFFGVGGFEFVKGDGFHVPIRVAATPGKAKYGEKAIEFAKKSIDFCEAFTGVDYPVDKLDLIALPAFAYGAMENLGAITYRENLLLYYPEAVSRTGLQSIASITAHEIVHMWFGDLTSPRDWQFVWLNEAFATYVGSLVLESSFPEWHAMDQFILSAGSAAMNRDSLFETIPIEFPEAGHTEIDSSTAPIIYSKAGMVLRMVHHWLGDEPFSAGVKSYLAAFEYDSTDTDGFLNEFGKGAGSEAAEIIENWIRQPGFPMVTLERSGDTLTLSQRRFTYTPGPAGAAGVVAADLWIIPVSLLLSFEDGSVETLRLLLKEAATRVNLPEGVSSVKLNHGQTGLYRSAYSRPDLERLLGSIRTLDPRDASGIVADLEALTIKGEISVNEFLDFLLRYYSSVDEFIVLVQISRSLKELWRRVPDLAETVAHFGRDLLEPVLGRIGLSPPTEEPYSNISLRNEIVGALLLFGSSAVREELNLRFDTIVGGGTVETDLIHHALCSGALCKRDGEDAFTWFRSIIENPNSLAEMKKHAFGAIGWFPTREMISQVLEYTMKSIQPQDRIQVIRSLASNPAADPLLWSWFEVHFDEIKNMHPYFRSVLLAEILPVCLPATESDLDSLLDGYLNTDDDAPRGVINMAREKRKVYIALKANNRGS